MATIEKFEDIDAWKLARTLVNYVYTASSRGVFARDFGLKDQIRRAAVSAMSNIAEGFERDGNKEFIQFLSHAKGSCGEVRSQLYVALDQQYITNEEFDEAQELSRRVSGAVQGFMNYLISNPIKGLKFRPPPAHDSTNEVFENL